MNFFEAMQELEKGNKVRNADWKDAIYLYKENQKICFSDACPVKCLSTSDLNYGVWEIYKGPILDKIEKEYLLNIIKPFKNRVYYIVKYTNLSGLNEEYIQICVKSNRNNVYHYISLPPFVKGSKYNNMRLWYKYSLKELGLDDKELIMEAIEAAERVEKERTILIEGIKELDITIANLNNPKVKKC